MTFHRPKRSCLPLWACRSAMIRRAGVDDQGRRATAGSGPSRATGNRTAIRWPRRLRTIECARASASASSHRMSRQRGPRLLPSRSAGSPRMVSQSAPARCRVRERTSAAPTDHRRGRADRPEVAAERPAAHPRCASADVSGEEYSAHLKFSVNELQTLADRLVHGDRSLLVGLKPARDRIRTRDGLSRLIAKPVDGRCDIRRRGAGADDADPNRSACNSPTSAWRSVGRMRPKSTYRAASTCVSIDWDASDGLLNLGLVGKPPV